MTKQSTKRWQPIVVLEALTASVAYIGVLSALMYPAIDAAGSLL